jgi:hypothetical protein
MAYLAQPTSKTDYGVVGVGDFINVFDGFISLEQDVSPDASVSFNQVTIDGEVAVTSVTPSSGDGIKLTDVVTTGNDTSFTIYNTGVLSLTAGDGISISDSTGYITISASGADLISTIGVTGSYTATADDEYIGVFSASAVTITLPVGVTGRVYIIKDEYGQGSGKITIKPSGTEKIDNKADYIISVPNQSVSVVFRGGQWRII